MFLFDFDYSNKSLKGRKNLRDPYKILRTSTMQKLYKTEVNKFCVLNFLITTKF